ncbi:UNVERIFIED_CONTAM: hypothetical protein FKN15_023680 [Acipenser sinensis]
MALRAVIGHSCSAQTSYQIEMTIWVTRVGGQGNIDLAVAASLVIKWLCQILPNGIFLLNSSVSFHLPSLGCGAVLMVDTEANEAQTQEQIIQLLESHNFTEGIYTVAAKPGSIRIQPIASTTGQVTPVTIFTLPVTTTTSTAGQTSAVPGVYHCQRIFDGKAIDAAAVVTSEASEAETKELIKQVLIQNSNYTDGSISMRADPASIRIQLIGIASIRFYCSYAFGPVHCEEDSLNK